MLEETNQPQLDPAADDSLADDGIVADDSLTPLTPSDDKQENAVAGDGAEEVKEEVAEEEELEDEE